MQSIYIKTVAVAVLFGGIGILLGIAVERGYLGEEDHSGGDKKEEDGTKSDPGYRSRMTDGHSIPNEIRRLEQRITSLERQKDEPNRTEEAADRLPEKALDSKSIEEQAEMQATQQQLTQEAFQDRVEDEARDPSWADHTEHKLVELFEGEVFDDTSLLEVSCRSTVCRLEMTHKNEAAQENIESSLLSNLPSYAQAWLRPFEKEDGEVGSVCYFVRDGFQAVPTMWPNK